MEIIYFYLLMIVLLLSVLIISIERLNKNVNKLYSDLDDRLNFIDNNVLNIYSYFKKIYENEKHKTKL